jgi:hypothetical protein
VGLIWHSPKVGEESAVKTWTLLHWLLRDYPNRNFAIELWDGECWPPAKNCFHRFTWKIKRPGALQALLQASDRQIALAEAYISGDFDILGDFEAIFPLADYLLSKKWSVREKLHLLSLLGRSAAPPHPLDLRPHLHGRLH